MGPFVHLQVLSVSPGKALQNFIIASYRYWSLIPLFELCDIGAEIVPITKFTSFVPNTKFTNFHII